MPGRLFRAVKSLHFTSPFPIRVSIYDAVLVSTLSPTCLDSSSISCLCCALYHTIYFCLIPLTRSWLSSASSLVTSGSRGCVICCGVWISSWLWVSDIDGVGSRATFGFSFAANAAFKSRITLATIDIHSAWIYWLSDCRIPFVSGISSSFSITVSTTNCVEADATSCDCWVLWRFCLHLSLSRCLFWSRWSSCVNWLFGGPWIFCCISISRSLFRRFFSEGDNATRGITLHPFNTLE